MREAGDRGWWQRVGEEGGMGVATLSVPFFYPEGVSIFGSGGGGGGGEQVHGNSEIIAYACEPDI